jgi:hypothetical protein
MSTVTIEQLTRIANALDKMSLPAPNKVWWRSFSYKDVTILTTLVLFGFSFHFHLVKIREDTNRKVASVALVKSVEVMLEDSVFRGLDSKSASDLRAKFLEQAKLSAPNDPYVVALAHFNRQLQLTADPKAEDGPEILALSRYPATIDPAQVYSEEIFLKLHSKWLNMSGAALLGLLVNSEKVRQSPLAAVYYQVAFDCLSKAAAQATDKRELYQTYAVLIQHGIRGSLYKFSKPSDPEPVFALAAKLAGELKASQVRGEVMTGLDATANLSHLRGQVMHLAGSYEAATKQYQESLRQYGELVKVFPDRPNSREIGFVEANLSRAKRKMQLGTPLPE